MASQSNPKAGLGALLTPDNCALILIDHQPFQFAGLRSHDTQTIINNVVGLAKSAKAFDVPTLLSTVVEERGGLSSSCRMSSPTRSPSIARSSIPGRTHAASTG
jgi:nicotinamidase-related amidase